jgi:lipoprotein signal peptidase
VVQTPEAGVAFSLILEIMKQIKDSDFILLVGIICMINTISASTMSAKALLLISGGVMLCISFWVYRAGK